MPGAGTTATALMIDAAQRLERGGADFFLICTNTMHRMADAGGRPPSRIPLLHIADPTAERIVAQGIRRVGLLGHGVHDGAGFLQGPAAEPVRARCARAGRGGPRDWCTGSSTTSWCRAVSKPASRAGLSRGDRRGWSRAGAEAVILGCTEIMLLVDAGGQRGSAVRHHRDPRRGGGRPRALRVDEELIAVVAAGHQAVLDLSLGPQLMHEEQAHDDEEQGKR